MSNFTSEPSEPIQYAVRFRERATRDATAAFVRFAETVSEAVAKEWYDGMKQAAATLATFPRRCPLVRERFHIEARHLLYSHHGSKVVYRILFTIEGEGADSPDAPTIAILSLRHAAAKPLTKTEIRRIEAGE